jgi:hypothetical protein
MIITSIWGSNRFRVLSTDTVRLAYLYLHTNGHGNSIGAYRLPPDYLAADMGKSKEEAEVILAEISEVGLIDYDDAENIVRILNWFPHNPINSPKHLSASIKRFFGLPGKTKFAPDIALEITLSAFEKAQELSARGRSQVRSAKTERQKSSGETNIESSIGMVQALNDMAEGMEVDQKSRFLSMLYDLPARRADALFDALQIAVPAAQNTPTDTPMDTPIDRGMRTPKRTDTETETHTETETDTQTETRKSRKISPDIQADIDNLTKKSKEA